MNKLSLLLQLAVIGVFYASICAVLAALHLGERDFAPMWVATMLAMWQAIVPVSVVTFVFYYIDANGAMHTSSQPGSDDAPGP